MKCDNCSKENKETGFVESWDGMCPDCGGLTGNPEDYVVVLWDKQTWDEQGRMVTDEERFVLVSYDTFVKMGEEFGDEEISGAKPNEDDLKELEYFTFDMIMRGE